MPKDIDIKRVLDIKWRLSATQGLNSRGEPQNLRRDALQDFENKTASMQNREPRKVVVYTSDAPPPPVQGDAEEVYYVKDKVLKSAGANLPYSLAAEMLTDQFRPKNWRKLSTDGKIKTIELLEQSMGLQQTLKGAAKPRDVRPRSVEVITGAGLPPYKFSAGGTKIQINQTELEKADNSSLGLDILDAMAVQQITSRRWDRHTPETRLSNLQLVECGMAARQGRFARRVIPEELGADNFGYYNDKETYRLTVSNRDVMSDVDLNFKRSPLEGREYTMFPNLEVLNTVLHEGRHATQHDLINGYLKPKIIDQKPEIIDQKPEVKELWKTNITGYIDADPCFSSVYRYQPIEADANDFANYMISNHLAGELTADPTYKVYLAKKKMESGMEFDLANKVLDRKVTEGSIAIIREKADTMTDRIRASDPKKPSQVTGESALTCDERKAVADGFRKALAGIGQSAVSKEERDSYLIEGTDTVMTKERLSLARGLLLNQGYKLSDILDPNKLQYSKKLVGKVFDKDIETQAIQDSINGYMRFNLFDEMIHMNEGLKTFGNILTEFADTRYQPQLLRVMSEFSESFITAQAYLKEREKVVNELEYNEENKEAIDEVRNYNEENKEKIKSTEKLSSLLKPDHMKALYDFYNSQEYLEGKTSATGELESKAADASFVLQETVVSYGKKYACTQPDDLSALLTKQATAFSAVKKMDSKSKAQYIQSNERIQEALGKFTADEKAKAAAKQKADETAKQAAALEKQRIQDEKIREEMALGEDMSRLFDMGPLPVQAPPPQVSPAPTAPPIPPTAKITAQELEEEEQREQGKAKEDSITQPKPMKKDHMDKKPVSIAHKS